MGRTHPCFFLLSLTPFESQGPSESPTGQFWSHDHLLVTWQERIGPLSRGESPQKEIGVLLSKEGGQMLDKQKGVRKPSMAPQ